MVQNTQNVAAASPVATGGVLVAPLGTPLPASPDDQLDPAFKALGYVSEDGVQYSGDAASTDDTIAWGGTVVATLTSTGSIERRTFKLLEILNPDVLSFIYGPDNIVLGQAADGSPTIQVTDAGTEPPKSVFCFDMITSQNTAYRRLIPLGQPVMSGQDSDVHSAIGGFEIQVTAFKNADGWRSRIWHKLHPVAPAASTPPAAAAWAASTDYFAGDHVSLTGGAVLEATVGGVSDVTEPASPAAVGDTVVDGTVTWTRRY